MSNKTFVFRCWQPGNETEAAAVEIEAGYASDAAQIYFDNHIQGFDTEVDGLSISVRDPYGTVDDFEIEIVMEPQYRVVRI